MWYEKPWSELTMGQREDLRVCAILSDIIRRLEHEQPSLPFPPWVWDRTTVELNPLVHPSTHEALQIRER